MKVDLYNPNTTLKEVLEDTIEYYSKDPEKRRCSTVWGCKYSSTTINKKTSDGCAIGRYLSDDLKLELDTRFSESISNIIWFGSKKVTNKLPKLMLDNIEFFQALQLLHDNDLYWESNGLSHVGRLKVEDIKDKYL